MIPRTGSKHRDKNYCALPQLGMWTGNDSFDQSPQLDEGVQLRPPSAPTSDFVGRIKLDNVGDLELYNARSAHCRFLGRACPAEITVGWSRSIWNSSGRRLASCLFQPGVVLYPKLSTTSKVLAFQSIVHPSCPIAVQTSPYFLFNSFASRKSDSNTSSRKHKYASARAAFYIVPVLHLSSLSEEKFGPQSGLSRKHK